VGGEDETVGDWVLRRNLDDASTLEDQIWTRPVSLLRLSRSNGIVR
jgi:hypothetical protein